MVIHCQLKKIVNFIKRKFELNQSVFIAACQFKASDSWSGTPGFGSLSLRNPDVFWAYFFVVICHFAF